DLEGADVGALEDGWVGQAVGDGEGGLAVDADHADDLTVLDGDEVDVLVVELVNEPAVTDVGILGQLADERAVVQRVDLLELVDGLGALENVPTDSQHPRRPPSRHYGSCRGDLARARRTVRQ